VPTRKLKNTIDSRLSFAEKFITIPELIPLRGSPVTIEEMANNLWDIAGGMVVRPKTLQKSVESYLTCFPYLAIQDSSRNIRDLPPEKKNIVYIKEIKSGIYIRL